MKSTARHTWILATVVVVMGVAIVQLAPAGTTAEEGKTYTVRTVRQQGSVWIAGGGKAMRPGWLRPGNRLLETNAVRRDDGARGVFVATAMVASPQTVAAESAVGMVYAVYRFPDGDIYVEGLVSFGGPSASGVIVGGTRSYQGAHGTFTATEAKDVLRLLP